MNALILLAPFDFAITNNILQQSPLTKSITKYLDGIKSQNPEKELNSKAFHNLLEKRNHLQRYKQLTLIYTNLRKQYQISQPKPGKTTIASLWTKKHSLEYIDALGIHLPGKNQMSATLLRDYVLHYSGNPTLALNPISTANVQQQTLTHVEDDVYEIEHVIRHQLVSAKKKSYFKYWVKWVGYDEEGWVNEDSFVGLTLSEYWKGQYDKEIGIKEAVSKKITHIQGYDAADDVRGENSYVIREILNAERYGETIFYEVLWAGQGGKTLEPEENFDNDVILTDYWRNRYLNAE
jgi:hypothetical protein